MTKIPRFIELKRVLLKLGYKEVRQSGSHVIFEHEVTLNVLTVPNHGGKEVSIGVYIATLKKVSISQKDFWKIK